MLSVTSYGTGYGTGYKAIVIDFALTAKRWPS